MQYTIATKDNPTHILATVDASHLMTACEEHSKGGIIPLAVTSIDGEPPPDTTISVATEPLPAPSPSTVFSSFGETTVDASAKARIDAQQAALLAAGIQGVGYKGEGGTGDQFYANGTRMMASGYDTQAERKAMHDRALPLKDAAHALSEAVRAEHREDVELSAREIGAAMHVNGAITVQGKRLSEQAIRGLLQRLDSPALGYVLGIRDRMREAREAQAPYGVPLEMFKRRQEAIVHADRAQLAEVLSFECKRNPDVRFKLRTRNGGTNDVFAVVSPSYTPADAPEVLQQVLNGLPADAKGTWSYDPSSTAWELRAAIWTPTPVAEQAVGEPFSGYVSFQSRDNGTSRFRGGGGIEILRCLNASVYVADGADVARMHRGRIMYAIHRMAREAQRAIDVLCQAWGTARTSVVEVPEKITIEQAIPGFWRSILTDRKSELAGVLPGRTAKHVEGLTRAYFGERRDPAKLVRADFGQAYTRYIQGQPAPVRREAEIKVSDWLMSWRPIACDLEEVR